MNKCPHCGSTNLSVISRVCGYLSYSKLNGSTRMNDAKMAEIKDRVCM
jgi:ribonucleoside-triphosphate reductase